MNFIKKLECLILFVVFVFSVFTQDQKDSTDEIVLPQMSLELEESIEIDLFTEFPEDMNIESPVFEHDLPVLNELRTPDFEIDVNFNEMNDETYDSERSFFSEGIIGFGLQNHTLGEINLYTIGSNQDFNLKFAHENIDGYAYRSPGRSYFNTNTTLQTKLNYNGTSHGLDLSLDYFENQEGLQGKVDDYQSYTLRFVNTGVMYSFLFNNNFNLNAGVKYDDFRSILSGSSPVIGEEKRTDSEVSLVYLTDNFNFQIKNNFVLNYLSAFENYDNYYNQTLFGFEYTSFENTKIGFNFLINYDDDGLFYPYELFINSDVFYYLNIKLSGGYKLNYHNYYDFGKDFFLIFLDEDLEKEKVYFGEASMTLNYTEKFLLGLNLKYENYEDRVDYNDVYNSDYGLLGVTQDDAEVLSLNESVSWSPSKFFSADLEHTAYYLDAYELEPDHSFTVKADFDNKEDTLGASILSEFSLDQDVPISNISIYAKVSSGLIFIFEANDILFPLLENGRTIYGDYETKGFEFVIKTQISF